MLLFCRHKKEGFGSLAKEHFTDWISDQVQNDGSGGRVMGLAGPNSSLLDVIVEFFGVFVLAEFGESFGFYLTDTFASDRKFLPYFFEGVAFAIF